MRKSASGLLAAAILQASVANGLGLGDIELQSALDQPLDAEIRLLNTGDLGETQILVTLGSTEDFDRVGADRLFFLTEFKFDVELDGEGNGRVHIKSDSPVREPYLDFVIEVRWPNGRVLREYTVLLDLPVYDTDVAPAPAVQPPSVPVQTAESASKPAPRSRVSRTAPAMPGGDAGGWQGDTYGPVAASDTLWSIANQVTSGDISVQRMMIGLQRANPRAFIRGNVNLLKAGYVLRVPTAEMLSGISQQAAFEELLDHDRAWRTGEPLPQRSLEAAEPMTDVSSSQDEAYLRLAGDQTSEGDDSASGGEADNGALGEQDVATSESLALVERENEELRARLEALEGQVEDYQRLIELKNNDVAAVQEQATEEPVIEQPEPVKPAPVAVEPEPGMLESLLQNTYAMVAAGLIVLVGLVLVLLKRRRSEDSYVYVDLPETKPSNSERDQTAAKAANIAPAAAAVVPNSVSASAVPEPQQAASAEEQVATTDPVAEAEIYIAYGRLDKATDMLKSALADDPDREEARLKLMEVYAEDGNQAEFLNEYAEFERRGDNASLAQAADILKMAGLDWLGDDSAADELANNWASNAVETDDSEALSSLDTDAVTDDALGELELSADFADDDDTEDDNALDDLDLGDLDLTDDSLTSGEDPEADMVLELNAEDEAALDSVSLDAAEADLDLELDGSDEDGFEPELIVDEDSDDLDFLDDGDAIQTQIELAQAYMDMGDAEGAREILEEVERDGNDEQRKVAQDLLASLGS